MAPYQFDTFSSRPYLGTIADLIQEPGRAQARAAEIGGAAKGQALAGMGQAIGGAIQHVTDPRFQMEQQQVAAMQRAKGYLAATNQIIAQLTTQNPDGTRTLDRAKLQQQLAGANVPLQMQQEVFKSLDDVDTSIQRFNQIRIDHRADFAHAALQSELGKTPQGIVTLAGVAKANGMVTDADLQPIYTALAQGMDPKAVLQGVRGLSEKYKDQSKPVVLPRPGAQLVSPTGATLATAPEVPEKPVNVPPGGNLVDPKTGKVIYTAPEKPETGTQEDQRYEKIDAARRLQQPVSPEDSAWAGAYEKRKTLGTTTTFNLKSAADKETVTDQAEQVRNGMLPPSMLSKRSSSYNAILAEANRQEKEETGKPLNIGQLELNYRAAQRFVASLNGPNMVRFQALGKSVVNTIDEVRTLADELKQGGIQKWNSAKRSTILQVYGNSPQSEIAVRYMAAVNTLKEEYANLANGGYAPTEPAWKLANDQINGDYGVKDLNASLTESQRLINFRLSGFTGLSPILSGGEAPTPPAAAAPQAGAKEGDIKPIPGFPGMEQTYRNGKWIRTK